MIISKSSVAFNERAKTIAVAGTSYSPVFDLTSINPEKIETTLKVTAISGVGATFDVIPQYSYIGDDDNLNWFDQDTDGQFDQFIATGSESLELFFTAKFLRFKRILAGTTPSVTFDHYSLAKA